MILICPLFHQKDNFFFYFFVLTHCLIVIFIFIFIFILKFIFIIIIFILIILIFIFIFIIFTFIFFFYTYSFSFSSFRLSIFSFLSSWLFDSNILSVKIMFNRSLNKSNDFLCLGVRFLYFIVSAFFISFNLFKSF